MLNGFLCHLLLSMLNSFTGTFSGEAYSAGGLILQHITILRNVVWRFTASPGSGSMCCLTYHHRVELELPFKKSSRF